MISETQMAYGSLLCRHGRSRRLRPYQLSNWRRSLAIRGASVSAFTIFAMAPDYGIERELIILGL